MNGRLQAVGCAALLTLYAGVSQAQVTSITSDGTLGTIVSGPVSGVVTITGGTRPNNGPNPGTNLFHSFGNFDVGTGGAAKFSNNSGLATNNIVGRVTGGQVSDIFGTLQTENFGTANLFLVNPAGFIFGGGAQLNVDGSFTATTADYLVLDDGWRLGAGIGSGGPLLTVAGPTRFGFLDGNVGSIDFTNVAAFSVDPGKTLSFVGGASRMTGSRLTAPGGRIDMAGVASTGEVTLNAVGMDVNGVSAFADVNMSASFLNADGDKTGSSFKNGGKIFIRGGSFTIEAASAVTAEVNGTGAPAALEFRANALILTNSRISANANLGAPPGDGGTVRFVGIGSLTLNGGTITSNSVFGGNAGDVRFENVGRLELRNGSRISADTTAGGFGGHVVIDAVGTLQLSNQSEITANSNSTSPPGTISITANGTIGIADANSAIRANSGGGAAGGIVIATPRLDVSGVIEATTGALGGQGTNNFEIRADTLNVNSGGRISTRTSGGANGGSMRLTSNVLTVSGGEVSSATTAQGTGGSIAIDARTLKVTNAGRIIASTSGAGDGGSIEVTGDVVEVSALGRISSDTNLAAPPGNGGKIRFLNVRSLTVDGGTITSNTVFGGNAGELKFENVGQLELRNNGKISANTSAGGVGGDVIVDSVGTLLLSSGGEITASSNSTAPPGTISITATRAIDIADASSGIRANSGGGATGGISIDAPRLDVSGIIEATTGPLGGQGTNNFVIRADALNVSTGGRISTRTGGGASAGSMRLTAGVLTVGGGEVSSSTTAQGAGGNISAIADRIIIEAGGRVTSSSTGVGSGNAGSISFVASDSVEMRDGSVATSSQASSGGSINMAASNRVYLLNSSVSASANGVTPGNDGGNVTIDPTFVILDDSAITASANAGNGGNIDIAAAFFIKEPESVLDATSQTGIDGDVVIESPNQDVTGAVTILDASFLEASALLRERCSAASVRERSAFTLAGKGGVRRAPDAYLASSLERAISPGRRVADDAGVEDPLLARLEFSPPSLIPTACSGLDWEASE